MREIKFRAWNGMEMVHDVMVGKFGAFYVNPGARGDGLDDNDRACLTPFNTIYSEQVPIMQFTGLKDKNGKEIYEGDIVSYQKHGGYLLDDFVGDIRYVAPGYMIKCPTKYVDMSRVDELQKDLLDHLDVIGNIYENPELLK